MRHNRNLQWQAARDVSLYSMLVRAIAAAPVAAAAVDGTTSVAKVHTCVGAATGVGAGDSQLGIWWVLVRSQIPCVVTVVLLTSRHGIRTIDSVLCCTFSMYWADTRIFTAMY